MMAIGMRKVVVQRCQWKGFGGLRTNLSKYRGVCVACVLSGEDTIQPKGFDKKLSPLPSEYVSGSNTLYELKFSTGKTPQYDTGYITIPLVLRSTRPDQAFFGVINDNLTFDNIVRCLHLSLVRHEQVIVHFKYIDCGGAGLQDRIQAISQRL